MSGMKERGIGVDSVPPRRCCDDAEDAEEEEEPPLPLLDAALPIKYSNRVGACGATSRGFSIIDAGFTSRRGQDNSELISKLSEPPPAFEEKRAGYSAGIDILLGKRS